MIIDMHSHWMPRSLSDALKARKTAPNIVSNETGRDILRLPRGGFPLPSDYGDIDHRLAMMDRLGIDACLFSLSSVFGIEQMPIVDSCALAGMFNDGASQAHTQHPDRIFAVATLPVAGMDLAVAEFERAMALPGIKGAILPGNAFLTLEAAQRYRPIFATAQKHGAHIMVHAGLVPNDTSEPLPDNVDNERARRVTLEMQSRISSSMITLCMTDFLDDYPDVTVQSHNLGGNIPFELDRLDHISLDRNAEDETPSNQIRRSQVVVDCNSMGPRSIEMAVKVYGAERIMLGTDGTDFGAEWSRKAIEEADIPARSKEAILAENARRVLRLA